jgi:hypothetical protein
MIVFQQLTMRLTPDRTPDYTTYFIVADLSFTFVLLLVDSHFLYLLNSLGRRWRTQSEALAINKRKFFHEEFHLLAITSKKTYDTIIRESVILKEK